MSKLKLFEYVVLHHITNKKGEVKDTEVLLNPDTILEKDEKTVAVRIHRMLPTEVIDDLDNVEIIVRPF